MNLLATIVAYIVVYAAFGSLIGIVIALVARACAAEQIEQEPLEWLDRERGRPRRTSGVQGERQ